MVVASTDDGRGTVGWREWVGLPDLDIPWIKAKIDTGARSSALHAVDLELVAGAGDGGTDLARFLVQPWQRSADDAVKVSLPVVDTRTVRSSNGVAERRPVVRTTLRVGERVVPFEVTLTARDQMGFRLLIGRQTLRGLATVDPERSFVAGRPPRAVRAANRRRSRR